MLAEHGLVISAGKMSGLWSGQPASIKLDDLDVICVVARLRRWPTCSSPNPEKVTSPLRNQGKQAAAAGGPAVVPKRRDGRLPAASVTPARRPRGAAALRSAAPTAWPGVVLPGRRCPAC